MDGNEIERETYVNQEYLVEVINSGISEKSAKHALIQTNNESASSAIDWYFHNMDSEILKLPIPRQKIKKYSEVISDPKIVKQIVELGFSEKQASLSLSKNNNNIERAIEYLLNNREVIEIEINNGIEIESKINQLKTDWKPSMEKGIYDIHALITLLGNNILTGHFVAHVKKKNMWVYYNDLKVAEVQSAPIGKSLMYFLRRF